MEAVARETDDTTIKDKQNFKPDAKDYICHALSDDYFTSMTVNEFQEFLQFLKFLTRR